MVKRIDRTPSLDAVEPSTRTVWTLCSIQFVDVMCVTIVVTALPAMVSDFGGTSTDAALIATAYATLFGGLLLFGSRVGERIGHRRSILLSIAVFAAGALMAAVAPTALWLAVARAIQGAAAACAVPSALTMLTSSVRNDRARSSAIAAWSACGAAAGISGYIVGGVLTGLGAWRAIFWSLLVVSALLAVAVLMVLPPDPPRTNRTSFNALGSFTVTVTIMLIVVGTSVIGEDGHRVYGLVALGVAAVGALTFRALDRRSSNPLLPRALTAIDTLRWGSGTAFVNTAVTSGTITLLTLHLQGAQGHSPLTAAAVLLPFSATVILGSSLTPAVKLRIGIARTGAAGMLLIAAGIIVLVLGSALPTVVTAVAVMGCGLGLSSVASTMIGLSVPETVRSGASGVVNTTAQLGTALGTAVLVLVAVSFDGIPGESIGAAAPRVAWLAAAAFVLAVAVVWWLHGRRTTIGGSSEPRTQ